jgi:imidazolonepropionase-like amidohydrolase
MDTPSEQSAVLIKGVRIFDGTSPELPEGMSVLVEGSTIAKIAKSIEAPAGTTVIDGGGRTLMPGIIEAHGHLSLAAVSVPELQIRLPSYTAIVTATQANVMLMNGVTTARDLGGSVFSVKQAIDRGLIPGPRIYPSGALISQTGGHADFRFPNQTNPSLGGPVPTSDLNHYSALVDGVPKMLAAVREQLRLGASQIKLAVGGGVASPTDPIDVTEFTREEIAAAVAAAENWGTYVTVHGYTDRAVNQAIDAGVRVIEHGHLLSRKTLERMAKEGIWLSFQPFTQCSEPTFTPLQNEKHAIVCKGTANVYEMIKTMPALKVVHGTDILFNPPDGNKDEVKRMERLLKWFTPFEILKMSTGNVGELLKLCGPRNPYPGDLGVVKEGAYADLLLVDGNPLEDLTAVTDRDNLKIIMKDGKIYKNTLSSR